MSIDKLYSYIVPADYRSIISVGQRVIVPFGKNNKQAHGIVVELEVVSNDDSSKLKSISYLYDDGVTLSYEDMSIAAFIKNRYFCTFFDAANALLPPGVWSKNIELFSPGDYSFEHIMVHLNNSPKKAAIVDLIYHKGKPVSLNDIIKETGIPRAAKHLSELKELNYISSEKKVVKPINDKFITMVEATLSIEEAEALLPKSKLSQRRLDVLRCLCQSGAVPEAELCYMTGVTGSMISGLV
ncbi:MAG: hypothetical protein IKY46_08535, partial [Clostridia bacterium]|nr:hypothetical protein [Clostridia bacterium]